MKKIVITSIRGKELLFLFDENHEVLLIKAINNSLVDTVFKGKIVQINQGLKACFVSISQEQKVFLPLEEFDSMPKCGDEIILQIKTDAIKTKLPTGSLNICIPGQFCVCHLNGTGVSASKKLDGQTQKKIVKAFQSEKIEGADSFKWVIRTNAEFLLENDDFTPLFAETGEFIKKASFIRNEAKYRSLYSVIYSPTSEIVNILNDISYDDYDSIVTDIPQYYDIISSLYVDKTVKFYSDEYVSLKNLHSLETYLDRALDKKVYLDCGGYLVIEQTEAMNVIDVNSGKAEGKRKDSKSFIYHVNIEACEEIARQLRLRNLSGIIIVDFINMDFEDNQKLLKIFEAALMKDRIQTKCVDMTKLGLVEVTRKKVDIPLDKALRE